MGKSVYNIMEPFMMVNASFMPALILYIRIGLMKFHAVNDATPLNQLNYGWTPNLQICWSAKNYHADNILCLHITAMSFITYLKYVNMCLVFIINIIIMLIVFNITHHREHSNGC